MPATSKLMLVMEYVEGGTILFGAEATERRPVVEPVAKTYFRDVVQAGHLSCDSTEKLAVRFAAVKQTSVGALLLSSRRLLGLVGPAETRCTSAVSLAAAPARISSHFTC